MIVTASRDPRQQPKISVVLSFLKEEDNIPELLSRLHATLKAEGEHIADYELIFLYDASTDGSERLLWKNCGNVVTSY